ncbi:hypothetical protein BC936DRAFT_145118 [Jimgerdemannia flammicorona]|uniref:Uncharacterized protein n=1 Tax=Jimgerdemannia flammicorona TaxID=994334 RepID=A0A433DAX6_9FUNG|nr:hypothetical protein BC936DRAFT_145118 [Jimgerdemannia flammicorona]
MPQLNPPLPIIHTTQLLQSSRISHKGRHSLDGARETFITLGIVVLETDLELNGLGELPLLLLGGGLNDANRFSHGGNADLTVEFEGRELGMVGMAGCAEWTDGRMDIIWMGTSW